MWRGLLDVRPNTPPPTIRTESASAMLCACTFSFKTGDGPDYGILEVNIKIGDRAGAGGCHRAHIHFEGRTRSTSEGRDPRHAN
jgi:hypothetical protein